MNEKLIDKNSILQCLGNLIRNPSLLEEYHFDKEDFGLPFYSLIFSLINNLYNTGINVIDAFAIDSMCSKYQKQYEIFNQNDGIKFIDVATEIAEPENFSFYVETVKKFSYLRYLEVHGYDVKQLYDYTLTEADSQEQEMLRLESYTVAELIDEVSNTLINEPTMRFCSDTNHIGELAGKGLKELKEHFKEAPDFGLPLQSDMFNTMCRGARLKKLYIHSGSTGSGKTRLNVADMVGLSVPYKYNLDTNKWDYTEVCEPVLIISTELDLEELRPMLIAYVAGVEEGHITTADYLKGEEERVDKAIQYIESSPLYLEVIHDFSIKDITFLIKKYKREKGVNYILFDYIHMSNKLIIEVASSSRGMKLREDQILFLFVDTLKNLCNTLNVFLLTATQLNGDYKDSPIKDETLLRGAKSIADRIDMGEISIAPSNAEMKAVEPILRKLIHKPIPNLVRNVYKLRGGKWSKIKIWQYADLGTCRVKDLFVTNLYNELIDMEVIKIDVDKILEENSVDLRQIPDSFDTIIQISQGEIEEGTEDNAAETETQPVEEAPKKQVSKTSKSKGKTNKETKSKDTHSTPDKDKNGKLIF